MHDYPGLILTALLIFAYGIFSQVSHRLPFSGPMFFMACGVLVSPIGLDLYEFEFNTELTKLIAEIALIVILFTDASHIEVRKLRETMSGLPARLLLLGLPLTIILGAVLATLLFPDMKLWMVALVALILSPTDAALGQAVISSKHVPERIRESISIESGLNDGIVLPIILVCIAVLAEGTQEIDFTGKWLIFMAMQLTLGPIVGGIVGWVGGRLVDHAAAKDWMEPAFQHLSAISLALLAFVAAEAVHGNGFIAAFFAGLFLGTRTELVRHRLQDFGEAEGQLLTLSIFLITGIVAIPFSVPYWDWQVLVYALLSLTVIRGVPVGIAMFNSGYDRYTVLFVGWFGPRGIASILYLLMAIGVLGTAGYERVISIIVLTVLLSTFLHGMTALPLTNVYRDRANE